MRGGGTPIRIGVIRVDGGKFNCGGLLDRIQGMT